MAPSPARLAAAAPVFPGKEQRGRREDACYDRPHASRHRRRRRPARARSLEPPSRLASGGGRNGYGAPGLSDRRAGGAGAGGTRFRRGRPRAPGRGVPRPGGAGERSLASGDEPVAGPRGSGRAAGTVVRGQAVRHTGGDPARGPRRADHCPDLRLALGVRRGRRPRARRRVSRAGWGLGERRPPTPGGAGEGRSHRAPFSAGLGDRTRLGGGPLGAFLVESSVAAGLRVETAGLLLASGSAANIVVRVAFGRIADGMSGGRLLLVAAMLAVGIAGFGMLATGEAALILPGALLA